jgi:flagellar motor switch protein FliN/FliY
MSELPTDGESVVQSHQFRTELGDAQVPSENLDLASLRDVKLNLSANLGKCKLLVRDIVELRRGSVLPLDSLAGEMADILLNGIPFAKGEVVVLVDSLHVRISEVTGATEKDMMDGV